MRRRPGTTPVATFLAFIAVVAAVILILVVLRRFPRLRRAVIRMAHFVFRPVVVICRAVSAIVDFFLAPRGASRRIAWPKYLVWLAVGFAPLAVFLAVDGEVLTLPQWVPSTVDPGYLLVAAGVFHVLVLAAALFAIHEDNDVMDGLVADDKRRIGGARSATRLPVVTISVLFFVAYAVAVAWWLAEVKGVALFDKRPQTGVAALDYLLIVLWSLPTALVLRPLDWFFDIDTQAVFRITPVARAYYLIVYATGSLLLAGLAAAALKMNWQLRRIVSELGEGRDGDRSYLLARARLAPSVIKRGILNAAIAASEKRKQRRLIEAARDLAIFTFPQTFCHSLETYDEETQHFGLDRSIELFRQRGAEFEREPCEAILRKAGRLLRRGKLGTETTKRLVRLAAAVLTVKRGVVRVDEAWRDQMFAIINRDLRTAGAEGDPALRGLLQDLRGAVARATVVKAAPPAAQPVGRGAQPGNPATTAPR